MDLGLCFLRTIDYTGLIVILELSNFEVDCFVDLGLWSLLEGIRRTNECI